MKKLIFIVIFLGLSLTSHQIWSAESSLRHSRVISKAQGKNPVFKDLLNSLPYDLLVGGTNCWGVVGYLSPVSIASLNNSCKRFGNNNDEGSISHFVLMKQIKDCKKEGISEYKQLLEELKKGRQPSYFNRIKILISLIPIDDLSIIDPKDDRQWTLLHWAAHYGDLLAIKALWTAGGGHYQASSRGETPIFIAIRNGHTEASQFLLKKKASIGLFVEESAAYLPILHWAARTRNEKAIKTLLTLGVEVDQKYNGETPIHRAISSRYAPAVEALVHGGANIHQVDEEGSTLLMRAAHHDFTKIGFFLLKRGACIHQKNSSGRTALHEAASNLHHRSVMMLLSNGADPQEMDDYELYPLHLTEKHMAYNKPDDFLETLHTLIRSNKVMLSHCQMEFIGKLITMCEFLNTNNPLKDRVSQALKEELDRRIQTLDMVCLMCVISGISIIYLTYIKSTEG